MSSITRVVDATSEPVEKTVTDTTGGQTLPIKIDTAQMQKVLQNLVGQQMQAATAGTAQAASQGERVNPSVVIKSISDEMEQLYTRFEKLKRLAVELHGHKTEAPIPDHVKIKNIKIDFSVVKDGKEEAHTADVQSVTSVGDVSSMLSTEFGMIILTLTDRAKQLQDIAQKTGERCSAALKEWEKNNKDKKIIRGDEAASVSSADDDLPVTDAPVTLEAS